MHDQTEQGWLKTSKQGEYGTALFLVPQGKEVRGSYAQDVTYDEARAIGGMRLARAMKWIPHSHASFDDIRSSSGACGQACEGSCVELGCLCNETTKKCQSAL
jgi:hypothetical protein